MCNTPKPKQTRKTQSFAKYTIYYNKTQSPSGLNVIEKYTTHWIMPLRIIIYSPLVCLCMCVL